LYGPLESDNNTVNAVIRNCRYVGSCSCVVTSSACHSLTTVVFIVRELCDS
jgi:hypothetical protein